MIDFLAPPRAGLFFAFSASKKPPQNVMANLVFIANFADPRGSFNFLMLTILYKCKELSELHHNEWCEDKCKSDKI